MQAQHTNVSRNTVAIAGLTARSSPLVTLRKTIQLFRSAADSHSTRRLVLALAVVALASLIAAVSPIALKWALDALSGKPTPVAASLSPVVLLLLYAGGQFLLRCATNLRVMLHGHAQQRVRRQIGRRLFEHVVRLPLRFHLERKTGAIGETAEQGLRGFDSLLQHLVFTIIPVGVEFIAVTFVLVRFGQESYLIILAFTALAYLWALHRWAASVHEPSQRISASHIDAHAVLTDSLLNHETVKYFDGEPVVCQKYDMALSRTEAAWRRFFTHYAANGIIVSAIFGVSLAVTLVLSAQEVARGTMTVGDLVLVNAYVVRLVQPLEMLGLAVRDIAQGLAFLGGMLALFEEQPEADNAKAHVPPAARGDLRFENVSFAYQPEREVLKNVTFCVAAGKTVAVVGASGSGKSSLIRLLFRLYELDRGRIVLDGVPISEMPLSAVRRAIAVVPQDTVLFCDSIVNNIGFGRMGSTRPEIEEAARLANLHEFILGLPDAYETVVGERGLKLSGGERQRVAIARAALKRPRIFVFDEATSSLDSKTEKEILTNLLTLSTHSTTLVIAHRLSTIVHADEIVVLDQGTVVERGTHDVLRKQGGRYTALWNAQQSGVIGRQEPTTLSAQN